jgi:hypothetical protein
MGQHSHFGPEIQIGKCIRTNDVLMGYGVAW